jgi:hypothetical protein
MESNVLFFRFGRKRPDRKKLQVLPPFACGSKKGGFFSPCFRGFAAKTRGSTVSATLPQAESPRLPPVFNADRAPRRSSSPGSRV